MLRPATRSSAEAPFGSEPQDRRYSKPSAESVEDVALLMGDG